METSALVKNGIVFLRVYFLKIDCSSAMSDCSKCDSSTNCQECGGGKLLEDSRCVSACKAGNFKNNDVCSRKQDFMS